MSKDSPSQELTEGRTRRQETPPTSSMFSSGVILLAREQPSYSQGQPRSPTQSSLEPPLAFPGLVSLPECYSKTSSTNICSVSMLCLHSPVPAAHPAWGESVLGSAHVPKVQEPAATSSLTVQIGCTQPVPPKRSHLHGEEASEPVL